MISLFVKFLEFYQYLLSPDHSFWGKARFPYGYCRFHPTCSEYLKEALLQKGIWQGLGKGLWRVLRCNPFSAGGYDPVINMARTHQTSIID